MVGGPDNAMLIVENLSIEMEQLPSPIDPSTSGHCIAIIDEEYLMLIDPKPDTILRLYNRTGE